MSELERRVRNLLEFIPTTPQQSIDAFEGTFWFHVAMIRSELKVLEASRNEPKD
jgi:hypothetical protein